MKINLEVNEKEIIKNVMKGLDEKAISEILIDEAQESARDKIGRMIEKPLDKKIKECFHKTKEEMLKNHAKEISKHIDKRSLKRLLNTSEFDELMSNVLWEYVELWLEQNELTLVLNSKKKKHYYPKK